MNRTPIHEVFLAWAETGAEEPALQYELFDYQESAAAAVSKHLIKAARDHVDDADELTAVVLAAPTGSGKTVIATSVIEAALDGDETTPGIEDATFLWVTDDPSLNRQTLHKMMAASSALALNRLITIEHDFDEEVFSSGRVYFLNIQKLSASATLSRSQVDGRTYSLWETISNTVIKRPYGFVIVVDEAHRGMATARKTRDTIVTQIIGGGGTGRPPVPVVWGISATPRRFLSAMSELGRTTKAHSVRIEDVRASGLLKDQIVLGHTRGVDAAESTLVRHAVKRVREYDRKWFEYTTSTSELPVHPALVVQVADKPSGKELGDLVSTILEEWHEITANNIVHTFADHTQVEAGAYQIAWCPPEDIQDRKDIRVVLCKTAITTGWDCPRAEVLLSLRVAKDIDLITQVMGRMVRTPLARRISTDEDLNAVHCILPKFDQAAVDAIADRFKAGDEETLASGTKVVTKPIELTRNPTLNCDTQAAAAITTAVEDGTATDVSFWQEHENISPSRPAAPTMKNDRRAEARSDTTLPGARGLAQEGLFAVAAPDQALIATGDKSVFDIIEALPSYTIPRRTRSRSAIHRLFKLAFLLAVEYDGKSIEPYALRRARNALVAVIDAHRIDLETTGELTILRERAASARLFERAVSLANLGEGRSETDTVLHLDARGIGILMDRARAALPEGLANDYVDRLAQTDEDVAEAMITTIALASDPKLPEQIELHASRIVEEWFTTHGSAITRLPDGEKDRFDRIKEESDQPLLTAIRLPTRRTEEAEGTVWERHVLSDANGNYQIKLRDWEEHVLGTELEAGAIAWYRNPPSGRHSLQIPYVTAMGISGLAPDFIFISRIGHKLVAGLIDPHGTHLADSVPKLKGLTVYATKHASRFHRIQSIAKLEGTYWMLNHLDAQVRAAIETYQGGDAADLFRQFGISY
ncbi:DEAD/DEAH box helicase [Nonomuraea sp. NPDC050663]|uniref:DEAD/DEAH box helicase n=1 Tax=Nonomuraea sp. NPDC050663 TaxID=3364370 RepID=UPI0037BC636E